MPTYNFKCNECNNIFEELFYKESDIKDVKCGKCGGSSKKIIYRVPAVKYVGLGWASVDSQSEKRLKDANDIASNMYEKRAERVSTKLSENDDFWQEIAREVGD